MKSVLTISEIRSNDKDPYMRDPDYRMYLEITDLSISGGLEANDIRDARSPKGLVRETLSGRAKLEGKDSWAVASMDVDKNAPIAFNLADIAESETRFVWRATIGFSPYDWEFAQEESFYVHGYTTPREFAHILGAVRTGHVERLRVAIKTTLWTKRKSSGFMLGMPMKFFLVPPIDKEDTRPSVEWANIASITWGETYGTKSVPAADEKPPKPQPVELPGRLYSMLSAITTLLVILMVLVFFRH